MKDEEDKGEASRDGKIKMKTYYIQPRVLLRDLKC